MSIQYKIKTRRESLGLTQASLAESIGVHRQTVSAWETGEKAPRGSSLHKLAQALKVSYEWISSPEPKEDQPETTSMELIGNRIRIAREAAGLTVAQLATKLGLSNEFVSGCEGCDGPHQVTALLQFADALNVNHKWLKDGEGAREYYASINPNQNLTKNKQFSIIRHVLREKSPWKLPAILAEKVTHGFSKFKNSCAWVNGEDLKDEWTGKIVFLYSSHGRDEEELKSTFEEELILLWNGKTLYAWIHYEPGHGVDVFNCNDGEGDFNFQAEPIASSVEYEDLQILGKVTEIIEPFELREKALSEVDSTNPDSPLFSTSDDFEINADSLKQYLDISTKINEKDIAHFENLVKRLETDEEIEEKEKPFLKNMRDLASSTRQMLQLQVFPNVTVKDFLHLKQELLLTIESHKILIPNPKQALIMKKLLEEYSKNRIWPKQEYIEFLVDLATQ